MVQSQVFFIEARPVLLQHADRASHRDRRLAEPQVFPGQAEGWNPSSAPVSGFSRASCLYYGTSFPSARGNLGKITGRPAGNLPTLPRLPVCPVNQLS